MAQTIMGKNYEQSYQTYVIGIRLTLTGFSVASLAQESEEDESKYIEEIIVTCERDGNGVTAPVNGTITDDRRIGITFNYQL